MISLGLRPIRDARCSWCGKQYMFWLDEESVVCGACGSRTDYYEAWKAWDLARWRARERRWSARREEWKRYGTVEQHRDRLLSVVGRLNDALHPTVEEEKE